MFYIMKCVAKNGQHFTKKYCKKKISSLTVPLLMLRQVLNFQGKKFVSIESSAVDVTVEDDGSTPTVADVDMMQAWLQTTL